MDNSLRQSKGKRIIYLDVVKAIAICLVCIGHVPMLVTMSHASVLHDWIYSFHMPLFMLLSGYFSLHSFSRPFPQFISRKAVQLLLPAVTVPFMTVVLMSLHTDNYFILARNEMIGGLWFLKTLFLCYLYVWIIKRLPLSDAWLCLISVIFACLVPHGYFLQFNWLLIFFWTGYFLNKYSGFINRYRLWITLVSTVYFIFFAIHRQSEVLTYSVLFTTPFHLPLQFLTSLSGSLAVTGIIYYLCKYFRSGILIKKFAVIGRYTLGIYVMQTIIIERLGLQFLHIDLTSLPFWLSDGFIIPLLGILGLLLSYLSVRILSKIRIINLFFFGNQY